MHEAAHEFTHGHQPCDPEILTCGLGPWPTDSECDCNVQVSAYWVEAALAEASALGRVVSFGPGATQPIDFGPNIRSHFPRRRCDDASKYVLPFAAAGPECATINNAMTDAIEANRNYWVAFEG